LAIATSGDLSLVGDTVEGATVRDWLKKNLPKQVTDFVAELLGDKLSPELDWEPDVLLELLEKHKVVLLDEAVGRAELAPDKIKAFASQHPDRICYFDSEHPVVCLAVAPPV
jgi:hypothetical protein